MPRKQCSSEQIITKLREAEVLLNQGMTVIEAARQLEISVQNYYHKSKEYRGISFLVGFAPPMLTFDVS